MASYYATTRHQNLYGQSGSSNVVPEYVNWNGNNVNVVYWDNAVVWRKQFKVNVAMKSGYSFDTTGKAGIVSFYGCPTSADRNKTTPNYNMSKTNLDGSLADYTSSSTQHDLFVEYGYTNYVKVVQGNMMNNYAFYRTDDVSVAESGRHVQSKTYHADATTANASIKLYPLYPLGTRYYSYETRYDGVTPTVTFTNAESSYDTFTISKTNTLYTVFSNKRYNITTTLGNNYFPIWMLWTASSAGGVDTPFYVHGSELRVGTHTSSYGTYSNVINYARATQVSSVKSSSVGYTVTIENYCNVATSNNYCVVLTFYDATSRTNFLNSYRNNMITYATGSSANCDNWYMAGSKYTSPIRTLFNTTTAYYAAAALHVTIANTSSYLGYSSAYAAPTLTIATYKNGTVDVKKSGKTYTYGLIFCFLTNSVYQAYNAGITAFTIKDGGVSLGNTTVTYIDQMYNDNIT